MKETEYKIHYKNFDKLKDKLGVYLIRNKDNNKLKIGLTNSLPRRFKEIKKSFQFCGVVPELEIECYIEYEHNLELEQYLHNKLKAFNHQNEWFDIKNINIVLDKLKVFEYKEPLKLYDITEKHVPKKREKELLFYTEYVYYKYRIIENYNDFKYNYIYIRCKGNESRAVYYVEKTYTKVTSMQMSFYTDDEDGKILNPKKCELTEEIKLLFDTFNTDAIIKYTNDEYVSLEFYFTNEYKLNSLYIFEQAKNDVINILTNVKFEECNNIEDINLILDKIDNTCIDVQEKLNCCMRNKSIKNYRILHQI